LTENFVIKKAQESDSHIILDFIKKLAEYEKLSHDVSADVEQIKKTLFSNDTCSYCLIALLNECPVGFALYFYNYSTFLGKKGLYLEDLFVLPEMRGKGFGKKILINLAKIAAENNCGRFEWSVLDWNKPAIDFYESLGAKPNSGWTVYRFDENGIYNLIKRNNELLEEIK
jgi:GNAT superfamily N-acetyltransferase